MSECVCGNNVDKVLKSDDGNLFDIRYQKGKTTAFKIKDNKLNVSFISDGGELVCGTEINFCPMCGRNLNKIEQYDEINTEKKLQWKIAPAPDKLKEEKLHVVMYKNYNDNQWNCVQDVNQDYKCDFDEAVLLCHSLMEKTKDKYSLNYLDKNGKMRDWHFYLYEVDEDSADYDYYACPVRYIFTEEPIEVDGYFCIGLVTRGYHEFCFKANREDCSSAEYDYNEALVRIHPMLDELN